MADTDPFAAPLPGPLRPEVYCPACGGDLAGVTLTGPALHYHDLYCERCGWAEQSAPEEA